MQQLVRFALAKFAYGYARPCINNFRNIFRRNGAAVILALLFPVRLYRFHARAQFHLLVAHGGGRFVILPAYGFLFLLQQRFKLCPQLFHVRRGVIYPKPYAACGFVHQIYRLIGQESVRYIAPAKLDCRMHGFVSYARFMVRFIALPKPKQYLLGLFFGRFANGYGLEPPRKGRVLFNVLAVFVQTRCAYYLYLPAGKRGL